MAPAFKDGRDDTWTHENLKEGKRYKAGESEGKRKRKHATGISKAKPRKQIKVQPSQQRGPLQVREQQRLGTVAQAYDASSRGPYQKTKYLELNGRSGPYQQMNTTCGGASSDWLTKLLPRTTRQKLPKLTLRALKIQ
jgi:hypothetical protein